MVKKHKNSDGKVGGKVARKLRVGAVLTHRTREGKEVTCTVVKDGFKFGRQTFTSISAAANAASEKLGQQSRTLNGWVFWGVERRTGVEDRRHDRRADDGAAS
jgi:hypothetical protein